MNKSSWCSTSLPALGVVSDLDFGHSVRCVVVFHFSFSLYFSDDIWCEASFHMLILSWIPSLARCQLRYLMCGSWLPYCWVLRGFVYLDKNPLSELSLANIFFQSVAYFFHSLDMVFHVSQVFFLIILIKSSLSILSFMDCVFGAFLPKYVIMDREEK